MSKEIVIRKEEAAWNIFVCGTHLGDASDDPVFPYRLMEYLTTEVFKAPIFAVFCSPNINIALNRLNPFKALIGAIKINVFIELNTSRLVVEFKEKILAIHETLIASELGFFVLLARIATCGFIKPLSILVTIVIDLAFQYDDPNSFFRSFHTWTGVSPRTIHSQSLYRILIAILLSSLLSHSPP